MNAVFLAVAALELVVAVPLVLRLAAGPTVCDRAVHGVVRVVSRHLDAVVEHRALVQVDVDHLVVHHERGQQADRADLPLGPRLRPDDDHPRA